MSIGPNPLTSRPQNALTLYQPALPDDLYESLGMGKLKKVYDCCSKVEKERVGLKKKLFELKRKFYIIFTQHSTLKKYKKAQDRLRDLRLKKLALRYSATGWLNDTITKSPVFLMKAEEILKYYNEINHRTNGKPYTLNKCKHELRVLRGMEKVLNKYNWFVNNEIKKQTEKIDKMSKKLKRFKTSKDKGLLNRAKTKEFKTIHLTHRTMLSSMEPMRDEILKKYGPRSPERKTLQLGAMAWGVVLRTCMNALEASVADMDKRANKNAMDMTDTTPPRRLAILDTGQKLRKTKSP